VVGVNETIIRDILRNESRDFEMTWDRVIPGTGADTVTVYSQSNILDNREVLLDLQSGPVFD
jgi:hypothetical protein